MLIEVESEGRVERRRSGRDLLERGARLAGWLQARGVRPGDRVCSLLSNGIEVFEVLEACRRLGAAPVAINHHSTSDETRYILEDSGARALVSQEHYANVLEPLGAHAGLTMLWRADAYEAAVTESAPKGAAAVTEQGVIIYTSGTTGRPKGVVRTPRSPEHGARYLAVFRDVCRLGRAPVHLVTGPLYHTAPSTFARFSLALGGRLVILRQFDAEAVLRAVEAHGVTNMHLVPTMMHRLLALGDDVKQSYDLSSLVSVQHAAAPCPIETKQRMIAWWGPVIEEYYGSTEAGIVTYLRSQEALDKPGSVGRAIDGVDLSILDDDGNALGPGAIGDVCVASEIIDGFVYHGDDDKRARAMRSGYYVSGDIGYLDEDGYLFLCDRRADLIIAGGVNIYPAEIEAALLSHPAVRDAAVYGVPDVEWGERVHAAVQLEAERTATRDDLVTHLRGRIARFKIPRDFDFVTELPRELSGKLFKRKLRAG